MTETVVTTISLPRDLDARVKVEARRRDLPLSRLVRHILTAALSEEHQDDAQQAQAWRKLCDALGFGYAIHPSEIARRVSGNEVGQ